jgi:hypothetical protein
MPSLRIVASAPVKSLFSSRSVWARGPPNLEIRLALRLIRAWVASSIEAPRPFLLEGKNPCTIAAFTCARASWARFSVRSCWAFLRAFSCIQFAMLQGTGTSTIRRSFRIRRRNNQLASVVTSANCSTERGILGDAKRFKTVPGR